MGYFGKLEEKKKAIKLREQGLSYKEILQHVSISKDTLSRWCKDIVLTREQELRLQQNKAYGQKKGSLIAATNKREERIRRINNINIESGRDIGGLTYRDKFIAGVALYAAEGTKMDGKGGFANADPQMIGFMVNWLTEYTKIPLSRLRGTVWLHEGRDGESAIKFWSGITGFEREQFYKTYITKSKTDSKKIRKNIHSCGVFTIRFSDSATHRKIMGWIYAFFNAKITSTPPLRGDIPR